MAGMKQARIPAGIRRGGARDRSQESDTPDQATVVDAPAPAPRRKRGTERTASPAATSGSASGGASGPGAEAIAPTGAPTANPYAGQKRRPMNHLVFEGISGHLRSLSEALVDAGYLARSASQAQLTQAILHFGMPSRADDAGDLIAQWTALTAVPIPSNPYRGQKRRPMNHLVYEAIPERLGQLSEQLIASGYPERSASQAQLTQAILHFGLPADADEAGELVQRWVLLTAGR